MNKTLADEYVSEYKRIHENNPNYGHGPCTPEIKKYSKWCEEIPSISRILDYGCGNSKLVDEILPDKDLIRERWDPAIPKYSTKPSPWKFDLVFCTDVMEHIPEKNVLPTLIDIRDASENALIIPHLGRAEQLLSNGKNSHVTQQSREWWLKKIIQAGFTKAKEIPTPNLKKALFITW